MTSGGDGGRARWVMLFAGILLAISVAPVVAESAPSQPAAPLAEDERPPLPDADDVREGVEAVEREEGERQRWLESPEAVREREESRYAFAGLGPPEAQELLLAVFSEELEKLDSDPARFLSEASIVQPLSQSAAVVSVGGDSSLLDAGMPVRVENEAGELRKVDLSLEPTAEGFEPVNPLTELSLPDTADETLEIGEDGIAVTATGVGDSPAQHLGDESLVYPEVLTDTDRLVSPISVGVEIFDLLRSVDSPEILRYRLNLPEGGVLRSDGNGGAEIVQGEETLVWIPFPSAIDAQGSRVPVELTVDEDAIALHIAHREADVAYPLLLDPILEDWVNQNWFNGYNHSSLDNGTWQYTESHGWIEGGTNCLYGPACWGRGLYVGMPSGAHWGGQFGHWSYSAPNTGSYLSNAWIIPFWRANHNCSPSQYPQPHDYTGMWGNGQWNKVKLNEAANVGSVDIQSAGAAFILGLGTGNGSAAPCRRDLAAGGVAVWLDDWEQPNLYTNSTDDWMDNSPIRLKVSASDAGLGVKSFSASAVNTSGAYQTWWTNHPCTGLYASRCPSIWDLAHQGPIVSFDPAVLPEGIRQIDISAYDVTGKKSTTTHGMTVRIDHQPPSLALSGTLTDQASVGTGRAKYTLKAHATDGDAATPRVGAKGVVLKVDGVQLDSYMPGCPTQSCEAWTEYEFEYADYAKGHHVARIEAFDDLDHVTVKEVPFDLTGDTSAPKITLGGSFATLNNLDSINPYIDISATAEDPGWGATSLELLVDGQVVEKLTQDCPQEKCSFAKEFSEDLSRMSGGSKVIGIRAKDAAGNSTTVSKTVYLDADPPNLELSGDLSNLDGQPLSAATASLEISASDEGDESSSSGIRGIRIELDEEKVKTVLLNCTLDCPETLSTSYVYDKAQVAPGPHTVTVVTADSVGNFEERTLEVDVPVESGEAPDCTAEAPATVPSEDVVSAATAQEEIAGSLPIAIEESVPGIEEATETPIDPTYESESEELINSGTLADGAASMDPAGGVSLGGLACLRPTEIGEDATEATVVAEDVALYANIAPATDTVIRPTSLGTTIVEQLRSPDAPSSFSWTVDLADDQKLVELPSGAIAITKPGDSEWTGGQPEIPEPEEASSPTLLSDATLQLAVGEYELSKAQSETTEEVVAVFPVPWVRTAQGQVVPALIEVAEDIITINLPPELDPEVNPNPTESYPMHMGMASISSLNGWCPKGTSPCGWFDAKAAAQYAVYWGNTAHKNGRNPFYLDFGDDNCTNFVSQILDKGGMYFMREGGDENDDGAWWYRRLEPWNAGNGWPYGPARHTPSWTVADRLPRHLWRFGLAHIDKQDPIYWTKGTILAEDWFPTNGKGDFNHVQFVVGTIQIQASRVPLVANSSSVAKTYSARSWYRIRNDINAEYGHNGWDRMPLVVKHTMANLNEKKHAPENLWGPSGGFNG